MVPHMSPRLRALVALLGGLGFAIVGVFLGRAIRGPEAQAAAAPSMVIMGPSGEVEEVTTPATDPAPRRLVTMIEPVLVAVEQAAGEALLEPEPEPEQTGIPGTDTGSDANTTTTTTATTAGSTDESAATPVVAGAGPAWSDEAAEPPSDEPEPEPDVTMVHDPFVGWFELPAEFRLPLIDPCAGVEPASEVPEGCPEGTGATVLAVGAPPDPYAFFGVGHHLVTSLPGNEVCPAGTPPAGDGQAAMTLFSRTPVTSAVFRVRPHGSTEPWVDLPLLLASSDSTVSTWMENFAAGEYSVDWGVVPLCFVVDRPSTRALDIEAIIVDLFDRPFTSEVGIVPATSPERPPTTAKVLPNGPTATVTARSLEGGMAWIRTQVLRPEAIDDLDSLDCESTGTSTPPADLGWVGRSPIYPTGVYDPAYSKATTVRFPMPIAGLVHVCAWIFPTENTLTPEAVDSLVLVAPSQQRPRVVLQGVRRWGEETIDRLIVQARHETPEDDDPCASSLVLTDIDPNVTRDVEQVIWECTASPLPAASDRTFDVAVRVSRVIADERHDEEVGIRIALDDCVDTSCEGRPREWYEVPIPSAVSTLCGTGFGSDGCSEPAGAGVVVIRVEYPVANAAGEPGGGVLLLDQITTGPSGETAVIGTPEFVIRSTGDPFLRDATVSVLADRPVRLGLRVRRLDGGSDCLPAPVEIPASGEYSDRAAIELSGLCAGKAYLLTFLVEEESGHRWEHESRRGLSVQPSAAARWGVVAEFLGGPAEFGFVRQFKVLAEGQSPGGPTYAFTSPRRGSMASCMLLDGTVARSQEAVPLIYVEPSEMRVEVMVEITTTGDGDCSGRSASGLGVLSFSGSFTLDQLRDESVLVLESPADSPLRLRVTFTRQGDWITS